MTGETRLPLYRECDSCGAANGVIFHHPDGQQEHYCPRCAQRYALYNAAYDQLEAGIREAVEAWVSIWGTIPGVVDLHEQLRQIGAKVHEEYKAGCFDREGVRSSYCMSRAA